MSVRAAAITAVATAATLGFGAVPALADSASEPVQERAIQARADAAVSDVRITQIASRQIRVQFTPPADTTGISHYQARVYADDGTGNPGRTLGLRSVGANGPKAIDVSVGVNDSAEDIPIVVEVRPQNMTAPTQSVMSSFTLVGVRPPAVDVRPLSLDGRVVAVTWQDIPTNPENEWHANVVVEVSRDGGPWQPGVDALGDQNGTGVEVEIDRLQRSSRTAVLRLPQDGTYRVRIGIQNNSYIMEDGVTWDEAVATMGSKRTVLAWGESALFTTTDAGTLAAPAGLTLQADRSGTVSAAWSKARNASSYRVEVNAGSGWRSMAQTPRKQAVKKVAPKLQKGQRVKVRVQAQHKTAKSRYALKTTKAH